MLLPTLPFTPSLAALLAGIVAAVLVLACRRSRELVTATRADDPCFSQRRAVPTACATPYADCPPSGTRSCR